MALTGQEASKEVLDRDTSSGFREETKHLGLPPLFRLFVLHISLRGRSYVSTYQWTWISEIIVYGK